MSARFVHCVNNGVKALMSVDWYNAIYEEKRHRLENDLIDWEDAVDEGLQIFTFVPSRRILNNPREMRYFTGIRGDVTGLLSLVGSEIEDCPSKSFYVPFSNGPTVMRKEHFFAVSHQDLVGAFGEGAETSIL